MGFTYQHDEPFESILLTKSDKQGRPIKLPQPKPAYKKRLPMSKLKMKDLEKLCKKGVIPTEYHDWYNKLPHSSAKKDDAIEFSEDESDEEKMED